MTLRNTKRIINYCVLIIGLGVWGSCNSKSQHVLLPVDNVKSYKICENNDTTTIFEEREEESREVIKFLLLSGKTQITYKSLRNSLYIGNSAFFFEIQAP